MANENNAAAAADMTSEPQTADKFQGFSTKDGEVDRPAPAKAAKDVPAGRVPNTGRAKETVEEPAEGADGAEGAEGQADKHKSAEKRISQAVGRQRAAERRAEAAEQRSNGLEARLARLEQGGLTPRAAAATTDKAPNPKDYEGGEFDARYLADVAKHEARAAVAEATTKVRTETATAAQQERTQAQQAAFTAKKNDFLAQGSETYDDFEEVVTDDAARLSQTIAELGMDSDFGVQILYELASDDKEARKVYGMSPSRQAAWFGRKEFELSSQDADGDGGDGDGESEETPARQSGPRRKVTQAPAPAEHTARGTGAVPKVSASTVDFAAFERMATPQKK